MDYPFVKTDGGKAGDKRRRHANDCAIRALALATGISYGECYDELADFYGSRNGTWFKNYMELLNYNDENFHGLTFKWVSFPAVKGQKRMNPVTFCQKFKDGTYIAKTGKHVFAVIDGVAHDAFMERPDRCIYGAWKVEKSKTPDTRPNPKLEEQASLRPKAAKKSNDPTHTV